MVYIKIGNDLIDLDQATELRIDLEKDIYTVSYQTALGKKCSRIYTEDGLMEFVMQLKNIGVETSIDIIKAEAEAKKQWINKKEETE